MPEIEEDKHDKCSFVRIQTGKEYVCIGKEIGYYMENGLVDLVLFALK